MKRFLLMSVVNSKLFYAVSTWANIETMFDVNCKAINCVLRQAVIFSIRAYRSISAEAAQILTESLPDDLLALERRKIRKRLKESYEGKRKDVCKLERETTLNH